MGACCSVKDKKSSNNTNSTGKTSIIKANSKSTSDLIASKIDLAFRMKQLTLQDLDVKWLDNRFGHLTSL